MTTASERGTFFLRQTLSRTIYLRLAFLVFLAGGLAAGHATAGTFMAFGPQNYTRGTGAPVTVTNTFSVLNPNTQYTLKAFNGGLQDSSTELVSSGFVTINGVQVLGPSNFNQNVTEVDVPVTLQASNTISVQVRGQPGGTLTIEIVGVDNDPPTIKAAVSPAPNAAGWNNTNVTITFTCSDATSAVTCPPPQTVTTEGANQVISGTAEDAAGNTTTTSVTLNIDKTPPNLTVQSPANGSTVSSTTVAVSGTASDALSGLAAVTCNEQPATLSGSNFSCSLSFATNTTDTISVQATDVAGNTASTSLSVTVSPIPPPVISSFTPTSAPAGSEVTITGNNFTTSNGGAPQVTLGQQNGGTIAAPIASFTTTSISFAVPTGAATGPLTVTVGTQSATSSGTLTITPSSSFSLTAAPNTENLIPGQSVTYAVSLNSTNGFADLAALTVSGLPSGVTATFSPAQITAGQTSTLTVTAPSGQTTGAATLTVAAAATVNGIAESHSANLTLNVLPVTTTFLGRILVEDPAQDPLAGVTVKILGVDGNGNPTSCSGQTTSDAAGNFMITNLPSGCAGTQLIRYDGTTATSPAGVYAGVDLLYTFTAGQVTTPPVIIHLPRIDNAETKMVQQNASVDQTFMFSTIPGLAVTVYVGTTFTLADGSQPNPFPLTAIQVPVDRLPDQMPMTTSHLINASGG